MVVTDVRNTLIERKCWLSAAEPFDLTVMVDGAPKIRDWAPAC